MFRGKRYKNHGKLNHAKTPLKSTGTDIVFVVIRNDERIVRL
jgi:hypothetical protein